MQSVFLLQQWLLASDRESVFLSGTTDNGVGTLDSHLSVVNAGVPTTVVTATTPTGKPSKTPGPSMRSVVMCTH